MGVESHTGFPLRIKSGSDTRGPRLSCWHPGYEKPLRVPKSFADLEFDSAISDNEYDLHDAVRFAEQRGKEAYNTIGVLSSLPEEVAICIQTRGDWPPGYYSRNNFMITRTPLLFFRKKNGGRIYAAASDSSDPAQNILLSRSKEAADAFEPSQSNQFARLCERVVWMQERNDLIDVMLSAAKDAGRETLMPQGGLSTCISTKGGRRSDAAHNPLLRVLLGDAQSPYASFLIETCFDTLDVAIYAGSLSDLTYKRVGICPLSIGMNHRDRSIICTQPFGFARAVAPRH